MSKQSENREFQFFLIEQIRKTYWKRIKKNAKGFGKKIAHAFSTLNGAADALRSLSNFFSKFRKELLLCILLLFAFSKVDKVQHFFNSFALDIINKQYDLLTFSWIFLSNGIIVVWLGYVFWHKPKNLNGVWVDYLLGSRRDRSYSSLYKSEQYLWQLAVIGGLPLLLAATQLSIFLLYGDDFSTKPAPFAFVGDHKLLVFSIVIAIYVVWAVLFKPGQYKSDKAAGQESEQHESDKAAQESEHEQLREQFKYFRRKWYIQVINGLMIILFVDLLFYQYKNFTNSWLIMISLILFLIFIPTMHLVHLFFTLSNCLQLEFKLHDRKPRVFDRYFTIFRYASYGFSVLFFILLQISSVSTTEGFGRIGAPIAVLLFVFIFYYQLIDFLQHNITSMRLNVLFSLLFLAYIIAPNSEHLNAKFLGKNIKNSLKRATLEDYFVAWAKNHFNPQDTKSLKVFLVAAEGGGSRSGAWTSSILTQLDSISEGAFRKQCFAISAVSGGSVGTGAILSLWDRLNDQDSAFKTSFYEPSVAQKKGTREDRPDSKYLSRIFQRNYVSNSISGLFFYDFFQSVPILGLPYMSKLSRTDRHQLEENDAIRLGLNSIFSNNPKHDNYYLNTNFLNLYYAQRGVNEEPKPLIGLPLFFPNTTRVQDGKRGIVSPVSMGDFFATTTEANPFTSALDVIGMCRSTRPDVSLSLAEAVSLSQLFPYISANIQLDEKVGTFMDGGVYENRGITTIYELCEGLKKIIHDLSPTSVYYSDSLQNAKFLKFMKEIDFRIILIYNNTQKNTSDSLSESDSESFSIFNPLSTLLQTPFSGHTDYAYTMIKRKYKNAHKIIEFPLLKPENAIEKAQKIVMSRWLSKYEMQQIFKRSQELVTKEVKETLFN